MTRVNKETVARILELNEKGMTNPQIAREAKVPRWVVNYHVVKNGRVAPRHDRANPMKSVVINCDGHGVGCRLRVYSSSVDITVCRLHTGASERRLRQVIETLFGLTDLELPGAKVPDSRLDPVIAR